MGTESGHHARWRYGRRAAPGLYRFNQVLIYQSQIVGPGAPNLGGSPTSVHAAVEASGLLWVPGWTLLGVTCNAVVERQSRIAHQGAAALARACTYLA